RAVEPGVVGGAVEQVAGNLHGVLIPAEVGRAPEPDFLDALLLDPIHEIELFEDGGVADGIWLVSLIAIGPHLEEALLIVVESVPLLRKGIYVDELDNAIVGESAACFSDVGND